MCFLFCIGHKWRCSLWSLDYIANTISWEMKQWDFNQKENLNYILKNGENERRQRLKVACLLIRKWYSIVSRQARECLLAQMRTQCQNQQSYTLPFLRLEYKKAQRRRVVYRAKMSYIWFGVNFLWINQRFQCKMLVRFKNSYI
jgi:hypothetical protein